MRKRILQITVLLLAVVSIVFGLATGEGALVLRKSVTICLECIGIG